MNTVKIDFDEDLDFETITIMRYPKQWVAHTGGVLGDSLPVVRLKHDDHEIVVGDIIRYGNDDAERYEIVGFYTVANRQDIVCKKLNTGKIYRTYFSDAVIHRIEKSKLFP